MSENTWPPPVSSQSDIFVTENSNDYLLDGVKFMIPPPSLEVPEEYSFLVLVISMILPDIHGVEYKSTGCTGTFVSAHCVLTAASCVVFDEYRVLPSDSVVVGFFNNSVTPLRVEEIVIHHMFSSFSGHNLALIWTKSPAQITNFPALPVNGFNFRNWTNNCDLIGFGEISTPSFDHFHHTRLNSSNALVKPCRSFKSEMICISFPHHMACEGDVGSPLICNGEIRAMYTASHTISPKCHEHLGSLFTPITPDIHSWILKIANFGENEMASGSSGFYVNLASPMYILLFGMAILMVVGAIYFFVSYLPVWTQPERVYEEADVQNTDSNTSIKSVSLTGIFTTPSRVTLQGGVYRVVKQKS